MTAIIKAIETKYKGYRFRSRLEARWAVFFGKMGIAWQYEMEGYELPSGRYLPDFWLPECFYRGFGFGTGARGNSSRQGTNGLFVEIKGQEPSERERCLCTELGELTGFAVAIAVGMPPNQYGGLGERDGGCIYDLHPGRDMDMTFMRCHKCCRVKLEYSGANYYYCDACNCDLDIFSLSILDAGEAARSARFEHGESP